MPVPETYNIARWMPAGFVTFVQQVRCRRFPPAVQVPWTSPSQIANESAQVQRQRTSRPAALSLDSSSNVSALVAERRGHLTRCLTIRTICSRTWKLWPVRQPVRTARSFSSTVSPAASCPPRAQSAKSGSIRIRFPPEFDAPGFGRIEILTRPETDNFHGTRFPSITAIKSSIPAIRCSPVRNRPTTIPN